MNFLSLEKEIFGLDISDRSLKMVNLKKNKHSFVLSSLNQVEIEPGIIEGGVIQQEEVLVKAIKTLLKGVKGKKHTKKYVAASLPEEKSFLQVIQMPKMSEEELRSAIVYEAENYIPLPISEVYLDYQTITPIDGQLEDHLDILIAATPKKIVNSYVSCLKKAGLVPLILEVEPQAISRAMVRGEVSSSPIIILDIGKSSTVFIIFAGRSIQFTCSIPVYADQLTDAISKSLKLDTSKAEEVKQRYDISLEKKDIKSQKIRQAMEPVLEDLVSQIKKYVNFYQDHASHEHLATQQSIEKIIICGGGANLKGLPEFLSQKLEIPVQVGNFWENFASKKSQKQMSQDSLSYVTALGLALRNMSLD